MDLTTENDRLTDLCWSLLKVPYNLKVKAEVQVQFKKKIETFKKFHLNIHRSYIEVSALEPASCPAERESRIIVLIEM